MNAATAYQNLIGQPVAQDRLGSLQERLETQRDVLEGAASKLSQLYQREQTSRDILDAHRDDLAFLDNEIEAIEGQYNALKGSDDLSSVADIVSAFHDLQGARNRVARDVAQSMETYDSIVGVLNEARTDMANAQDTYSIIESQIEGIDVNRNVLDAQISYARDTTERLDSMTSDYMNDFASVDMIDRLMSQTSSEYQSAEQAFNEVVDNGDVGDILTARTAMHEAQKTYWSLHDQRENIRQGMDQKYEQITEVRAELETARTALSLNDSVSSVYVREGQMVGVELEGGRVERFDQPSGRDTDVPYMRIVRT